MIAASQLHRSFVAPPATPVTRASLSPTHRLSASFEPVRLTQIKLAGFKSFVDPTHFALPGQLVGVVGPNGCGKSNIIDAARWVLGESKASELRGESMQDVIFNGSAQRKAAGRASVELVFDNTPDAQGKQVGGPWAQYAEIAVKRVLTRDGTSTYLINNQVVRRRDIQDIFLGTGLGPRAYAIIGQGMISRIIEARPDELRIFLEEAAGVSKYKERRRETENRLADTRENLTRVEDILRELNGQIDRLEQQAIVARRYRDLESEVEDKQQLLWMLRVVDAEAAGQKYRQETEAARVALEARTADLRRTEAELEKVRSLHQDAGTNVHARQGAYYEAASAVSAIEAEIRVVVDARNRIQTQLAQLVAQRSHWEGEQVRLARSRDETREALAASADAIVAAEHALEGGANELPEREAAAAAATQALDAARAEIADLQKDLELEAAHQRNAERHLDALSQRQERLREEGKKLHRPEPELLAALTVEADDLGARLTAKQAELEASEAALPAAQAARVTARDALERETRRQAELEARLKALQDMQQRVQGNTKLQPWLDKHGLGGLPRFWQRLQVKAGWETALEAALRERLGALATGDLERARAFFADAPPTKLAFYSERIDGLATSASPPDGLVPLATYVDSREPALRALLGEWLAGLFAAESDAEAFAARERLPAGGTFVLRSGHQVGRASVQFHAADSEQAGLLARQHEIDDLQKDARAQALLSDEARANAVRADAAVTQTTTALQALRQVVTQVMADLHAKQMKLQQVQQAEAQSVARAAQIDGELGELVGELERETTARDSAEAAFQRVDAALATVQERADQASQAAEAARAAVVGARAAVAERERALQDARYEQRSLAARDADVELQATQATTQLAQVVEQHARLEAELAGLSDETARVGLDAAIATRLARESELTDARAELDALVAQIRAADEARLVTERDLEPLRTRIAEMALKEQAARLTLEQFDAQLAEVNADRDALRARLADDGGRSLRASSLQGEVQKLQQSLAELGAVNLAALDELGTSRERKTFLDAQFADLASAIETLEDAIRKIDRETRELLQETFTAINTHFGQMFPALFGGGEARLIMTGDEILDAGVQVMAQPPGKKNSSIHLLSGGEKALTATALVFAMFQLNPAPFCLLDEVDAPLDDANTERFCNLVKQMSANTQFLFISHNKIAMEMAQQLIGVTMQEQGVSRVVAVDLESAVGFANERIEEAA